MPVPRCGCQAHHPVASQPLMPTTPLPFAVLDALHDLTHAYRNHMRATLQAMALPFTPNELRVLLYLGHHPLCTHKDVMAHTGADKALVARTLVQMEAAQWLERVPHPQDKRSRHLRLSPQGHAAFAALRAQRQHVGLQMLEGSDPAQQQQLLQLLEHMQRNLAQMPPAAAPGLTAIGDKV